MVAIVDTDATQHLFSPQFSSGSTPQPLVAVPVAAPAPHLPLTGRVAGFPYAHTALFPLAGVASIGGAAGNPPQGSQCHHPYSAFFGCARP